jgi:hypothetical protein
MLQVLCFMLFWATIYLFFITFLSWFLYNEAKIFII